MEKIFNPIRQGGALGNLKTAMNTEKPKASETGDEVDGMIVEEVKMVEATRADTIVDEETVAEYFYPSDCVDTKVYRFKKYL